MENQGSSANIAELRKSLLYRLVSFGAFAWEAPRMTNGMPTVNCVWNSQYYGFYPVRPGIGNNKLKPFERTAMKRLIANGAICAAVSSIEEMEAAMNMDALVLECKERLPRKEIVALLRKWGDGKLGSHELQRDVLALDKLLRDTVYSIYFDHKSFNRIAQEQGVGYSAITERHRRAIDTLRNMMLKSQDTTPGVK